jgi:hypothetical protein
MKNYVEYGLRVPQTKTELKPRVPIIIHRDRYGNPVSKVDPRRSRRPV